MTGYITAGTGVKQTDVDRELTNGALISPYLINDLPLTYVPNPPCQLSLWEETGVPGENTRLSAER